MLDIALTLFVILLLSAIGIYFTAVQNSKYWQRRGIPGPPTRPFSGNMRSWWGGNIVKCIRDWTAQYGSVYGIQEGASSILVISDMDMLHELFVKKFEKFHGRKNNPLIGDVDTEPRVHVFAARGARWKRLRAIANQGFSIANLKKVVPILNDSCRVTIDWLEKANSNSDSAGFNIHYYFQEFTMDVIARVAMGQEGSRQFDNELTDFSREIFGQVGLDSRLFYYSSIWPQFRVFWRKFTLLAAKIRHDPFSAMRTKVTEEVAKRKKERNELLLAGEPLPEGRDFIDFFLEIESDQAYDQTKSVGLQSFDRATQRVSRELTTDEIVAMSMVFLLAGFDTTANTLALTCYHLMKHPKVQERLTDEIEVVCNGGEGEEPTYEQLNQLKYLEAVMKETLRLCPIAAFASARICSETTTLGDYTVEAGTYVQADVWACHYNKEIWGEDVEEFRPERMLDGQRRHLLSWFPFGAGPRTCVGIKLAYLEEKSMLVHLLRKYRLVPASGGAETKLNLRGGSILSPESVNVKLVLRDKD